MKKTKTTYEKFLEKLSPKEKQEFDEGYRELLLSELALATIEQDETSIRELTKMIDAKTNTKRPDFKTFKQKLLQDTKFKKEYDALKPEFDLIRESIKARIKKRTS